MEVQFHPFCGMMLAPHGITMRLALFAFIYLSSCALFAQNDFHPLPHVEREPAFDLAPQFPGGSDAMMRYFRDSTHYPADERSRRIQGSVLSEVMIDTLGQVSGVRVINGVPGGPALAREAERLLQAMPTWTPATKKGRPVEATLQLSVPFRIDRSRRR